MSTRQDPQECLTRLRTLLDDREWVNTVLSLNPSDFTTQQTQNLLEVASHILETDLTSSGGYNGQDDDEDDDDEGEADDCQGRAKKRKRNLRGSKKSGQTRNPWQRIMNIRSLSLPAPIKDRFAQPGFTVESWLSDDGRLDNRVFSYQHARNGDAFQARLRYTFALSTRIVEDQVRRCFVLLFWYDLVQLIRPRGCGRVGSLVKEEVIEFLRPMGWLESEDMKTTDIQRHLNRWSNAGKRLAHLCSIFDEGCLFILANHFSDDFLKNKCPLEGPYYDKAIQYLKDLRLRGVSVQSKAAQHGASLRRQFIEPFKAATRVESEVAS